MNAKAIAYTTRADLSNAISHLLDLESTTDIYHQRWHFEIVIKELTYCLEKLRNVYEETRKEEGKEEVGISLGIDTKEEGSPSTRRLNRQPEKLVATIKKRKSKARKDGKGLQRG